MERNSEYHSYNIINGFIILERSKENLYRGYDHMKAHFRGNLKFLATETDSLKFQIFDPEDTIIEKMAELKSFVDFSRLPPSHILYDTSIKNKLGSWKLTELNIYQFISLKSKIFSYVCVCDKCFNTFDPKCKFCAYYNRGKIGATGYPKSAAMNLNHQHYNKVLQEKYSEFKLNESRSQFRFNSLDTRRYFVDREKSFALGHYKTL